MEFLVLMAVLVGAGMFGYRQWLEIQERSKTGTALPFRPTTHVSVSEEPQSYTVHYPTDQPVSPTPLDAAKVPEKKAAVNKYVVAAICAIYIISPIDFIPDFLPILGWGDDLAAFVIAYRSFFQKP